MLSDVGSRFIEEIGMLNPYVREQHDRYGIAPSPKHERLPFPATFLLDERGNVADRWFHESYRVRETGHSLIARVLGITSPPAITTEQTGEVVGLRIWTDSPAYKPFQRLTLYGELTLPDGWHVYTGDNPQGYKPLRFQVGDIPDVEAGEIKWSPPQQLRVPGFEEDIPGYEGSAAWSLPITFMGKELGDVNLSGTVSLQLCTENECLVPSEMDWDLLVPRLDHVPSATGG